MSLLKIYEGERLRRALNEIVQPIKIDYAFVDEPEAELLLAFDDLRALVPQLSVERKPLEHSDNVEPVDHVKVGDQRGNELIFVGPPLGTELAALVSALIVVGRGASGLQQKTRQTLHQLAEPIQLEVFTTPT